jgi:RNA polymerase sigma-70 factor (ECF subfamily)
MSLGELTDEELIQTLRTRSGPARDTLVEELFRRHYQRVARWCLKLTSDREAAADLAQDVFLKAHRHLDSFKGSSRFSTWLYTIVRNESLNRLQRSPPPMETDAALVDVAAVGATPQELAERGKLAERLRGLLVETLDQIERVVFTLHYGDEMSLDAITRLLGLTNASGAKAYIVSAKRKLARVTQRMRAKGEEL